MSAGLRRAMADLSPREREVLVTNVDAAADRWTVALPRVAAVWSALAGELREVAELQQARAAVAGDERHTMREAKRARR